MVCAQQGLSLWWLPSSSGSRMPTWLSHSPETPLNLSNCAPAAAAAKSLQSCPTLCNPIDGSPPGSLAPGILQARTLEWVAISFSNACKWKVKVKSLSCVWPSGTPWSAAYQAPPSMESSGKSTGVGCHPSTNKDTSLADFPGFISLMDILPWLGVNVHENTIRNLSLTLESIT